MNDNELTAEDVLRRLGEQETVGEFDCNMPDESIHVNQEIINNLVIQKRGTEREREFWEAVAIKEKYDRLEELEKPKQKINTKNK